MLVEMVGNPDHLQAGHGEVGTAVTVDPVTREDTLDGHHIVKLLLLQTIFMETL
jgi:hypothetical protein